jgi:hypothetical protein
MRQWSLPAVFPMLLLAACSEARVTPETQAHMREKAEECRREGVSTGESYSVDQFGQVTVSTRAGQAAAQTTAKGLAACIQRKMGGRPPAPTTTTSPTITPAPSAPASNRTAERLKELESLRQQQLISDVEYQAARKRILDGL